jgi:hypothetical protein
MAYQILDELDLPAFAGSVIESNSIICERRRRKIHGRSKIREQLSILSFEANLQLNKHLGYAQRIYR